MSVLERFYQRDRNALSRIISYIENREENYLTLLSNIYPKCGRGFKIGITGPPGAGKSTLVDKLASLYLQKNKKIGIIAVDPTSPFTGGALLGDRVRMQELSGKGDVFIRSMATRGSGGGLAASTREISMVLDAFGCDIIIIETVGVGQIELDIAGVCDSVVVVLVPESGDGVQTLKAGLMEIADIFAVNKADRMGSARLIAEIRTMLNIRGNRNGWNLPVIKTEAINNVGIEDLEAGLNKHCEFLQHGSQKQDHQRSKKIRELKNIVREKLFASLLPELLDKSTVDYYINKILNGETDPYTVVEEIFKRIELKDKNIL